MRTLLRLIAVPMALLAMLLSGCATPAPMLQATWYLQETGDDPKPSLYIAVLNRSAQTQRIERLVLNSPGGDTDNGWTSPKMDAALQPGGLLVSKVNDYTRAPAAGAPGKWPDCLLPVAIVVQFAGNGSAQVGTTGQMPSALPRGWEKCP